MAIKRVSRSSMVTVEAALALVLVAPLSLICGGLLGPQYGPAWSGIGWLAPLVWPIGWAMRRVTVSKAGLREVRFLFLRTRLDQDHIQELRFDLGDVGWGFVPASTVSVRANRGDVPLPTQTRWAMTSRQVQRGRDSARQLAEVLEVRFVDRTI